MLAYIANLPGDDALYDQLKVLRPEAVPLDVLFPVEEAGAAPILALETWSAEVAAENGALQPVSVRLGLYARRREAERL